MTNPTVPRRRLGHELTRLRKASGLLGEQVATMMEWSSSSKLYKIEKGRQGIQPKELRELLGYYGITDSATVDDLVALARLSKQRAWWTPFASSVHDSYSTYVGLEGAATALRIYEPTTVVGLLQTEAYARALFDVDTRPKPEPAAADNRVRMRIERQALLTKEDPLRLWAILDEGVLLRKVGSDDVMAGQYDRLLLAARLPSVTLQILPAHDVENPVLPTNFTIIESPEQGDPDVVYIELLTGGIFVEGADVRRYNVSYDHLRAAALSPTKSIQLIKSIAAGRGDEADRRSHDARPHLAQGRPK
jgi:transcriptional regulator with XRE-family HTH domain